MGFYSEATLVKEAQRHGVEVRTPCLKKSAWRSQMEGESVRLGLRTINGLGGAAKRRLEEARATGAFTSAQACFRRCVLPRKSWLVLAEAGAFDAFFNVHRRQVIWRLHPSAYKRYTSSALPEEEVNSQVRLRSKTHKSDQQPWV